MMGLMAIGILSQGGGYTGPTEWIYPTAGVYEFTVPVSGTYQVEVIGGGGAGGNGNYSGGGGGGGGKGMIEIPLSAGEVYTITVGAGGELYSGGETSSFGSLATATGGSRGAINNYPSGGASGEFMNTAGFPNIRKHNGGSYYVSDPTYAAGGGGGSSGAGLSGTLTPKGGDGGSGGGGGGGVVSNSGAIYKGLGSDGGGDGGGTGNGNIPATNPTAPGGGGGGSGGASKAPASAGYAGQVKINLIQ